MSNLPRIICVSPSANRLVSLFVSPLKHRDAYSFNSRSRQPQSARLSSNLCLAIGICHLAQVVRLTHRASLRLPHSGYLHALFSSPVVPQKYREAGQASTSDNSELHNRRSVKGGNSLLPVLLLLSLFPLSQPLYSFGDLQQANTLPCTRLIRTLRKDHENRTEIVPSPPR
jgi:hypothetical protein